MGYQVGLALGGGGARGISHIGVLKVFEKYGIPVHCIAGTSIGSIVGAVYAFRPDAEALEKKFFTLIASDEFQKSGLERFQVKEPAENFFGQVAHYVRERIVINLATSRSSVLKGDRLAKLVDYLLDDVLIEDAPLQLSIVASDLARGNDFIQTSGSVREAAMASSSIPGFLPPFETNGHILTDGAVTCPVPVEAARARGADVIFAVDVGQDVEQNKDKMGLSILDIMYRTNQMTVSRLRDLILAKADYIIRPEVGHLHWADFSNIEALIDAGMKAAEPVVRDALKNGKLKKNIWERLWQGVGSKKP